MKLDAEQLRILREMDVDAALKRVAAKGFTPDDRKHAEAGLHKCRVELKHLFSKAQVKASKQWLKANGYRQTRRLP